MGLLDREDRLADMLCVTIQFHPTDDINAGKLDKKRDHSCSRRAFPSQARFLSEVEQKDGASRRSPALAGLSLRDHHQNAAGGLQPA
ncbi:hypothetical protein ETR14_04055 [Sphingosinicella sp. BN140058]|nr:hypothetical protein ETR14_04055 [Sphingosinicella sp. BN140058]